MQFFILCRRLLLSKKEDVVMLELPEVLTVSAQLQKNIVGKRIDKVLPPSKLHKFCWYNGAPEAYEDAIKGNSVEAVEGFGIYVEITFDNGYKLCFNDGVNARLVSKVEIPKAYQLAIEFKDNLALIFTVAMYGGIILHQGNYDNEYYIKSKQSISPLSEGFKEYYEKTLLESKQGLSVKAFLATEQRFPGIGNGVLQDILFVAGIHPKRKINTLSQIERNRLFQCIIEVLGSMVEQGGRNTEKDIFGHKGGYEVLLSKNTLAGGCPKCHGQIVKEAYLGGSIYYCPSCQPFNTSW